MKKLFAILVAVLLATNVFAQAPQKMSYQAVIRDVSNNLVTSQSVGMRISILQGATPVYVETHTTTTNTNGLISIEIGGGSIVSGSFASINWGMGTYNIKTETDPTGGTNYTAIVSTNQLLSVPYALNAKTSDSLLGVQGAKLNGIAVGAEVNVQADWNATSGDAQILNKPIIPSVADGSETKVTAGNNVTITGNGTTASPYVVNSTGGGQGFTHYIGELYGGGIVVSVWKTNGVEHGLIASSGNLGSLPWTTPSCQSTVVPTNGATSLTNGLANSNAIVDQAGAGTTYAAGFCRAYNAGGFNDWYLPAAWELNELYNAGFIVNTILASTNGFINGGYMSSTEYSATAAYTQELYYGNNGAVGVINKSVSTRPIRAVRRF